MGIRLLLRVALLIGLCSPCAGQTPEDFATDFNHSCRAPRGAPDDEVVKELLWYRCRNSNTVVVFIHGFNSNNRDAWRHENGSYWPAIVAADSLFERASIVLAPFYTTFTSGEYSLSDASRDLWSQLKRRDPEIGRSVLDHPRVLFIAHSTGGVLLRHFLARHQGDPLLKSKYIGAMLLASPSAGSAVLVEPESGLRFFSGGEVLADRDHISMAKPSGLSDSLHARRLSDFYRRHFQGQATASRSAPFVR